MRNVNIIFSLMLSLPFFTECSRNDSVVDLIKNDIVSEQIVFACQQNVIKMYYSVEQVKIDKECFFKMQRYYVMDGDTLAQDSTLLLMPNAGIIETENKATSFNTNAKEEQEFVFEEASSPTTEILTKQSEYAEMSIKENCFLVVSKKEEKLYVCENPESDTVRLAEYPVCLGLKRGQKENKGDMRTPESGWEDPFTITEIKNASTWCHNFGDGRGDILAYGNWFMRLSANGFSGIGIHGSTNNEGSVPGRGSEGCIRLRNDDLDELKSRFAFNGMKVVVKAEEEGLRPFELKYY